MSTSIPIDKERIADFCSRWSVTELALFGSVLRDDFGPASDVDVLVTFAPDARTSLFDLVDMEDELSRMIGRKVDLVCKQGIERSHNAIRKKAILNSVEVVYGT